MRPSDLAQVASELLAVAVATRRTEALLVRAQAAHLAWLSEGNRTMQCGFSSLSSLALEVLGLRPRTVRERTALHRSFLQFPALERAFLDGQLTACQALASASLLGSQEVSPESMEARIEALSSLSVRELRFAVRKMRHETKDKNVSVRTSGGGTVSGSNDEPEGRTISFFAPVGFQVVFDQMVDLARKVIGRDAPIYECMEAILMETNGLGMGLSLDDSTAPTRPPAIPVRPKDAVSTSEAVIARARETVAQTWKYLLEVRGIIEAGEPKTPEGALTALRQIHLLRAPQRVLLAHILRDLRRTNAIDCLGYRSIAELVEDRLRLSERSARNRVAESLLFEGDAEIERAYAIGEISIMQAHLIRRLARTIWPRPFVDRARQVTWRQFQREYRLLELLRKCDLGGLAREPLPQARIEETIISALGGERDTIEAELRARGIPPLPADGATDPAENPVLMDRLEALVELLVLSRWEDVPLTGVEDRQTSAAFRREIRIRFWVPNPIASDLHNIVRHYREICGRRIPRWAVMVLLFAEARQRWGRQDPERRPAHEKILRRDNYRCVIPGCTSRSHLETSHNLPKSQGGTDDPANLSVVCHGHHHHGMHKGYIRVTGSAPHALRIELGCRPGRPPMMVVLGNRILKGPFDPMPMEETQSMQ